MSTYAWSMWCVPDTRRGFHFLVSREAVLHIDLDSMTRCSPCDEMTGGRFDCCVFTSLNLSMFIDVCGVGW